MQDTAYKHTGLTGCHRFRLQKLCQVGRFAKKRSKGNTFMSDWHISEDRKSTRLNSSHIEESRMPSSA